METSALETFVTDYLAKNAGVYYIRQLIVICCLFVFGALVCDALLRKDEPWVMRALLAYPVGISAFCITAYIMLVAGIPYNRLSVCAAIIAEAAFAIIINRRSYAEKPSRVRIKHMLTAAAVLIVAGAVATSGYIGVSISNDTMYYFRRYPDAIVHFGGLKESFDFFLTDTGLGSVAIDTLPALFSFNESFGIRELFQMDFVALFAMCVYDRSKRYLSGNNRVIAAVLITAVLAVSTPFVILGHWALANMYFMEMFFIVAYRLVSAPDDKIGAELLMLVALALFRIEGTLFVVWLVICVSIFTKLGKKLALFGVLPMAVLFSGYCFKIFVQFYLYDNIYHFLTPQKAVMLICMMICAGIFTAFIQPRLPGKISKYLPLLAIFAMILGNAALLILNSTLYIGNLKAFAANLFRQSGWGMLPHLVIAMTVFLVIEYGIRFIKNHDTMDPTNHFNITMLIGFILITVAASYGRGDVLDEAVGDSGNRVLLQVVPIVVMTFGELFMGLIKDDRTEG